MALQWISDQVQLILIYPLLNLSGLLVGGVENLLSPKCQVKLSLEVRIHVELCLHLETPFCDIQTEGALMRLL